MNQYKDQITRSINLAIEALTTKPELKNEAKKQLKAAQMLINNYWNG